MTSQPVRVVMSCGYAASLDYAPEPEQPSQPSEGVETEESPDPREGSGLTVSG